VRRPPPTEPSFAASYFATRTTDEYGCSSMYAVGEVDAQPVAFRFVLKPHPELAATTRGAVFKLPGDDVEIVVPLLTINNFAGFR
jgi:hypothetical protein